MIASKRKRKMFELIRKLRQLGPLFDILKVIRPEDIQTVLESVSAIVTGDSLKQKIIAALEIADVLTDYTETTVDDAVVDALEQLMQSEGVDAILDLFAGGASEESIRIRTENLIALSPVGLKLRDDKAAIPWPVVIQIAMFVYELIKEWSNDE